MSDDVPKAMGLCGRDLETKTWKAGTRVECEFIGLVNISYPNRGVFAHLKRFCGACRHSGGKD